MRTACDIIQDMAKRAAKIAKRDLSVCMAALACDMAAYGGDTDAFFASYGTERLAVDKGKRLYEHATQTGLVADEGRVSALFDLLADTVRAAAPDMYVPVTDVLARGKIRRALLLRGDVAGMLDAAQSLVEELEDVCNRLNLNVMARSPHAANRVMRQFLSVTTPLIMYPCLQYVAKTSEEKSE